ncbi:AAA domain-containing protein [Dactylosporangium sp. NPDC050688]|uniref:DEAD/DEAH box helicase n=1 Tax=Dactylosporangium sp. NPDC050688 TaxID=3157217 RepID=UPI0033F3164D
MSAPLGLPPRWVDELRRQRMTGLPEYLYLSELRGGVTLPPGTSLRDVEADLNEGAWLVADQRRQQRYRLGGARFEVALRRRPAEQSREPLAVAYEVRPIAEVPPSVRLRATCAFVSVFDEVPCDLQEVLARLHAADKAVDDLSRGRQPLSVQRHGRLRAAVTRAYGQLGTLLTVLEERADRQPDMTGGGVVLPGDRIRVELDAAAPGLYRRRVTVTADGLTDEHRTSVGRVNGRVLDLEPIPGWEVPPGTRVEVTAAARFAMRQNADALQRFQRDHIEGNWEDLATLLCDPGRLRTPEQIPEPPRYFCDTDPEAEPLNGAQRDAVARALATPHAHLIQGPPGTGKTTVISELVQQLIARGERVLLLAPSHVAVDEVLMRVGAKPGVRALRITWSADKVGAGLHPYLFDHVGRDLARLGLRDGAVRRARWGHRLGEIDRDTAALRELRAAAVDLGDRLAAERSALDALRRARASADLRRVATEGLVTRVTTELRTLRRQEPELVAARDRADEGFRALRATLLPRLLALRTAALAIEPAAEAADAAAGRVADARSAVDDWSRSVAELTDRLRQWRAAAAAQEQLVAASLAAIGPKLAARQAALARRREGWLGRIGLADFGPEHREVRRLEDAWRRWSERRAELERSAERAAADERRLVEYTGNRDAWQRLLLECHTALVSAEAAWDAAVRDLAARLPGGRGPDPGRAAWLGAARTLGAVVQAHLEDPASARAPADWPALGGLDDELAVYRAAAALRAETADRLGVMHRRLADGERELPVHREAAARADAAAGAALRALSEAADEHAAAVAAARRRLAAAGPSAPPMPSGPDTGADLAAVAGEAERQIAGLAGERERLARYPALRDRWESLIAEHSTDDLVEDVRTSFVRATNLVCATTKGIVSRGSAPVRDTDYDTLIVDEASRVTESEFLIGAVRARRWILVGDEHQLPPHVDGEDERHLHALTAIHRVERGAAPTLEAAVGDLAALWQEDDELRQFRRREVTEQATTLLSTGEWAEGYRETFQEAHRHFTDNGEADAELLQSMRRHLVHSLFQQAVGPVRPQLRTALEEQRRMVPALARVVREPVYGGRYRDPEPAEFERLGLQALITPTFPAPVVLLDTSRYQDRARDEQVGHGFVNRLEQDAIVQALVTFDRELFDASVPAATVSVLAFYKAQAEAIRRRTAKLRFQVLELGVVDVIDAIQGQQADIVMLSFTRTRTGGVRPGSSFGLWLQDVRRLNVACTRARRSLVLVGHGDTLRRLNGIDAAQRFYAHLFELFATDPDFQVKPRFQVGRR